MPHDFYKIKIILYFCQIMDYNLDKIILRGLAMSDMTSSVHNKKQKNTKDIALELSIIESELEKLKALNRYDVDMILNAWRFQVRQLNFFYCNLVNQTQSKHANDAFFNLSREPKLYQLIYVHLGRGFPKELYDGHWCYYYKNCKTKYLVIPVTSIKSNSSMAQDGLHLDIEESDGTMCRLRFDEMRTIDKMRIDERKGYIDIKTDCDIINAEIESFLQCDKQIVDKSH